MSKTSWWTGPVKSEPDFNNLLAILGGGKPDRPTLFEFFLNDDLHRKLAPEQAARAAEHPLGNDLLRITAYRNAGYDYAVAHVPQFEFPSGQHDKMQTRSQNEGFVITDRSSFDAYPWPDPDKADYGFLDKLAPIVPKGMKLGVAGPCGVLENVTFLLGYENMCYLIADAPSLAGDVFEAVGSRLVSLYRQAVRHASVGFVIGNDDWGFKSQPMLPPDVMRQLVFPWHRQIVEAAHSAGKPAILHSCGNLASVMDDIVDTLGYDGKHSYEDTIQPVEEAYEQYGARIGIMGGLDVDFLCRSTPEAVYERAKAMLARTADRGHFALGSGNSIPNYIPHDSYFAMIRAANEGR
jgi:uroporphyrinogen decarboxylase